MYKEIVSASEQSKIKSSDFGSDFFWGISASALQTEGAHNIEGKGFSIWDEFASKRNKILNRDTPSVAADFYSNYEEDISIIKALNIPNFRLSFAWSRIIPNGTGVINRRGLNYYHKVIDACIANGIEPWVTLYHWDLPLELEVKGGWTNRAIINWFVEYVELCVREFKGKVKYWMVINEPMAIAGAGHFLGIHAPGKKGKSNFLSAMHHVALCQSIGLRTIKSIQPDAIVGTTFSCSYITPYSNSDRDRRAANRIDALLNRAFIEPALGMGYPIDSLPFLSDIKKYFQPGDEDLLKANFDFVGIQNYTREVVKASFYIPYLFAKFVPADKRKVYHTLMDWEVYPESIYEMIKKFAQYEGIPKLIITENGASFPDEIIDGEVNDRDRKRFIQSYLEQVLKAKNEGLNIHGYFVWSLTDNFEWTEGYRQRYGLVYIDFYTQKRTIKNSGYWYRDFLSK